MTKHLLNLVKKNLFLIILLVVSVSFFIRLFVPQLSLFVTPDFGLSDILHGYYPIKYLLSESLKQNKIQLWASNMADGYPVFADGQIGTLSLMNLLLYKFFSFALAINFSYILIFFLGGFGTYLYCREIKLSRFPSLMAGVIFSLSGFNIGQITHISLLQAAAFFPLELYFTERIIKYRKKGDIISLAIVLSQQIFCGHQQMTAYSLISIGAYLIIKYAIDLNIRKRGLFDYFRKAIMVFFAVVFGIIMSSALLIPSVELFLQSGVRNNIDILNQFPYPLNNLLTFINPFFFGNSAKGTYPVPSSNWGIFWENNGYVGLIPLICLLLSFFYSKKTEVRVWLVLLFFSILMVLGRASPFYFLYNFPPLSFFRVPARFLMLTDLGLAIISALVIQYLLKKLRDKSRVTIFIMGLVFILQVANIFYYFFNYHPVISVNKILSKPDTIKYLDSLNNLGKVYVLEDTTAWNNIFLKSGWQDINKYDKFKSGIIGHSNLYFQTSKFGNTTQFPTKRTVALNSLINYELVDESKNSYRLATASAKLMGLNGVSFIVTSKGINLVDIPLEKEMANNYIYKNPYYTRKFRMVYDVREITTVQALIDYVNLSDFNPKTTAIIEEKILGRSKTIPNNQVSSKIDVITYRDELLVFKITTNQSGIFVLSDTYYPGWKAYIDKKETKIFPVNINQKGISIDKGSHMVKFVYDSLFAKIGFGISTIAYFLAIILLIKKFLKRFI